MIHVLSLTWPQRSKGYEIIYSSHLNTHTHIHALTYHICLIYIHTYVHTHIYIQLQRQSPLHLVRNRFCSGILFIF